MQTRKKTQSQSTRVNTPRTRASSLDCEIAPTRVLFARAILPSRSVRQSFRASREYGALRSIQVVIIGSAFLYVACAPAIRRLRFPRLELPSIGAEEAVGHRQ